MTERLETRKYTFTVEGETESWYFEWLQKQINNSPERIVNVSIQAQVQQSPAKFYKRTTAIVTPVVYHICDVESNEERFVKKFEGILSEMKDAKKQKGIRYCLGYSNFTFELWMILHKRNCSGPLTQRGQYLNPINQAYNEKFENLDQYKHEDNFKRCLSKLCLDDVRKAIDRAEKITESNKTNSKPRKSFGFTYYRDNPSLSIHTAVKLILKECGLLSEVNPGKNHS